MSLVQLESFVAVAEEAHVGRAARRLHVSQPPLSRRIIALEDELGVQLFERTSRGMKLSPSGSALLPRAREVLWRVAEVQRLADELATEPNPSVPRGEKSKGSGPAGSGRERARTRPGGGR